LGGALKRGRAGTFVKGVERAFGVAPLAANGAEGFC
jgi:hypothetical protein